MTPRSRPRVDVRDLEGTDTPLRALADASIAINGAYRLDDMLAAVAWHARIASGARVCTVTLSAPPDAGQDLTAVSVSRSHAARADAGDAAAWHEPPRGLLVPLAGHRDTALGVVRLSEREEGDFDGDDEAAVTAIAQIVALAIERHRREEEAAQGRRDLAEAQRIAHLGSWINDFRTGRLTWSDEALRIFGLTREGFTGTYEAFLALVHPSDRGSVERAMSAAFEGSPYRIEHRITRADGRIGTVLERAEIERDEQGRPTRMLGTVLDVTRRRQAEDALRAQSTEISALAADRRRLIAETLDAEERVRERIAETLHDGVLQDVLAARQDVLECTGGDPGEARLLGRAREGLAGVAAGLRAAVGELHPMTLTDGGLATALQAVARAAAARGGFALDLAIDPGAEGVNDRVILALAREFLENAQRHSGAATVVLRVDRIHGVVRIVVADDGVGLDDAARRGAFGLGHIGLASARERVADLGGALTIDSSPGTGTRIVAVVPRDPARVSR